MKYIIIPLFKLLFAIALTLLLIFVFPLSQIIYSLWTFKFTPLYTLKDFLEYDSNSVYITPKDPKKIYKTVFHWVVNGNYKNLD